MQNIVTKFTDINKMQLKSENAAISQAVIIYKGGREVQG